MTRDDLRPGLRRFLGFVSKEARHILRDRRTLLILFGMPIAQILLFGFAITNELKDAGIAVLDPSRDSTTRAITEKLVSSGYFHLSRNLESASEVEEAFRSGRVKMVLSYEPDFAHRLADEGGASIQIIADASDPNVARTLSSYATGIIASYQLEQAEATGAPPHIEVSTRMLYNPELKGVFMFVPGVMTVILMLVSAMMTSISIAREKEMGTMEVLLVSPLHPLQIIIGKVLPYLLLSMVNASLILFLGVTVFGMPVEGSLFLLAAETVLFCFTTLSLGILISTVAETQQVAMMVSLGGLMLPTIILSGFIFPISSLPLPLRILSNAIPARWFIVIIRGILLKGVGVTYLWKPTLVLVVMTALLIAASVKRYRLRLD